MKLGLLPVFGKGWQKFRTGVCVCMLVSTRVYTVCELFSVLCPGRELEEG